MFFLYCVWVLVRSGTTFTFRKNKKLRLIQKNSHMPTSQQKAVESWVIYFPTACAVPFDTAFTL